MNEPVSRYNININRSVYITGDLNQLDLINKVLGSYYFLQLKNLGPNDTLPEGEAFFLLFIANFSNTLEMQKVSKLFDDVKLPLAHKIIYILAPQALTREQLLFTQEIGARFVVSGVRRNDDLRDYLKRYCLEISQIGSLANFEKELEEAYKSGDRVTIQRMMEKLKGLPDTGEQVLTMLAMAQLYLRDSKRAEVMLKKILQINPQNLWAANELSRLYLRTNRAAIGIETMAKLSQFHELNAERLLALGNAYAQCGQSEEAEKSFTAGDRLSEGKDQRFKDGLVKVNIIHRDYHGAMSLLSGRTLSPDVVAFLNLRAIMAIRAGNYPEGIEYYQYAASGVDEALTKAKLKFNLGLAFARNGDLEKSQMALRESLSLGGRKFDRAKGPLEVVAAIVKNHQSRGDAKAPALSSDSQADLSDLEWENLTD